MRHGLYLPTEGDFADVRLLARLAREAEDAGWDGLFIWDELLPIYEHSDDVREALGETGDVVDSFVALTAIAAHTERLRFGALVTPLPRLRPEVFARQTATLDRFSDGRLILGVGLGNPPTQFTAFGGEGDAGARAAMVDEFLDVLVQLWSGNKVKARGPHYVAEGVSMTPTPLQSPRIPIWIGADSRNRAPRRRAARWDGFVPASDSWPEGVISPAEYEAIVADIGALRPQPQTGPFDVVVIGNASGTLPTADSLPAYAAAGVTWVLTQALSVDEARRRIASGPPGAPAASTR
jgi:alkanesulfonate monooxygenase SsuD/methylene tetrahydromethanopterin reductase-like flavin-dependent oxidoreductase (luciferase family)